MSGSRTVTVVIPVYNRPDEAIRAVESALRQTHAVSEIIVVDDGSSSPVDAPALEAHDPRIRVLLFETNRGGGAARNAGIDAASSEWVALLDSDDIWLPEKLEMQFARIDLAVENPRVVAATNVLVCERGKPARPYNDKPPREPLSEWLLVDGCTYQTSGLLLPTALARAIRFDERLRRHQDWDFVLRLAAAGAQFIYLDECPVIYEATPAPGRVSQGFNVRLTLDWFAIAGPLLTVRARHFHYMIRLFDGHARQRPVAACAQLARLSLAYWKGPLHTARFYFHRAWINGKRTHR